MKIDTCILCGNKILRVLTDTLRFGEGKVLYCKHCHLGILEEQVDNPVLYYANEYRKLHKNAPDEDSPEKIYQNTKDFQQKRIERLYYFAMPSAKVLEIGCSAGQFLSHIKQVGFDAYGVEYDPACRRFVRERFNIPVFSEIPEDETFDVICLFQVLEHIQDPIKYLSLLKNMLYPNGKILIEVPNIDDALLTKWENEAYRKFYFHEAHNWYFSSKALSKLAEKTGLRLVFLDYIQDYSLYAHLQWHFLGIPTGISGLRNIPQDKKYADIMNELDSIYRRMLEDGKIASNIFIVLEREE